MTDEDFQKLLMSIGTLSQLQLTRLRRFDRPPAVESGFSGEEALINQREHVQKRLRCRPTPLRVE
jgi:hypothetical protein